MTVRLLDELVDLAEEDEFHSAAILTYTLGLRFFEELVLPRLQRLGIGRIGIAADYSAYHQSLQDPLGAEGCGRAYQLAPVRIPAGIQHAKVLWLQGRERQVAYVGSHNLTAAGLNDQLECTVRLDSRIPGHTTALRDLRACLLRAMPTALEVVSHELAVLGEDDGRPAAYFMSSYDKPLLVQLGELIGSCDEVRVTSPYLDPVALESFMGQFEASTLRVEVPEEGADIPLSQALSKVPDARPYRAFPRHGEPHRFVHAKNYWFRRAQKRWLALGSANCTQAALLKQVGNGGNLEFLVVLEDADVPSDGPTYKPVEDIDALGGTGRSGFVDPVAEAPVRIDRASWKDNELHVQWHADSETKTAWLVVGDCRVKLDSSPAIVPVAAQPHVVGLALTKAEDAVVSSWVEYPEYLDVQMRRRRMQRMADLLGSEDPRDQVTGIDRLLNQITHDLLGSAEADNLTPRAAFHRRPQLERQTVGQAIEELTFATDEPTVDAATGRLLGTTAGSSSFALLMAFLGRLKAAPPARVQNDEDATNRFEERRESAHARLASKFMSYLGRAAATAPQWDQLESEELGVVIRSTFELVVTMWDYQEIHPALLSHTSSIAERIQEIARCLGLTQRAAALLHDPSLTGLYLAVLGLGAQASPNDTFLRNNLRNAAIAVAGQDPRPAFAEWMDLCGDQIHLIEQIDDAPNLASKWRSWIENLVGIASAGVKSQVHRKWGTLLELEEADRTGAESREEVRSRARCEYNDAQGTRPVYLRYDQLRRKRAFPIIRRVQQPICDACHVRLSERDSVRLRQGQAVICPQRGHILLIQE